VKCTPETLEARGFKGGEQVLVFRRETTGPAAKVALQPDGGQIDANGEDISMVAVETQDRQGRVVPVANNHEPAIGRYHSRWDISRRGLGFEGGQAPYA
jgi:beta-galactosidase